MTQKICRQIDFVAKALPFSRCPLLQRYVNYAHMNLHLSSPKVGQVNLQPPEMRLLYKVA